MPRSIPFAPKLLPHHFGGICKDWVQPVFQNHDFRFSPTTLPSHKIKPKQQNHGTWLCTNHAKINSFCSPNSPTSLWRHFWGLSPACFAKPWFLFFTQHNTKSQNQVKTPKSWNLALHKPCLDRLLLLPHISHITLEAFVRIKSKQFSKTMIFVFHPTYHQVTKSSQNTKIIELGYAPTMPRSIPFALKLFPHNFGGICEDWVQPVFQNHDFRFSPHTPPSDKIKPKHQNITWSYQPCKYQFLLLLNFSHNTFGGICEDWVQPVLQNHDFRFHPTHHQVTKSSKNTKIMELVFPPTLPRSIPFAPKLLPRHFRGICEDWVHPVFQNHDFRFLPTTPPSYKIKPKHLNHWTWLCTNQAKINPFCSQTSPNSLWRHLWGLSPTSFAKPWFSFHPTHHQITKSSQNTKIMELVFPPTLPRSIPFGPKLLPHHFGGICEDWVHPVFQIHDFRFSPTTPPSQKIKPKHQNHWTWLCTVPYQGVD